MQALLTGIVFALAAAYAIWHLISTRTKLRALRAVLRVAQGDGFAARATRGMMEPLLRRATADLGRSCGSCPASASKPRAPGRHARSPH